MPMCYCTNVLGQYEVRKLMLVDTPLNPLPRETKMLNRQSTPAPDARRTVIPAPKTAAMLPAGASSSKSRLATRTRSQETNVAAIFTVDPRSGVPLYLQLIEQVKRAVALGTLGPGEQLPPVKALALDLTINPNTVARAYRDLERDAVIETSPGRGSFVRSAGSAVNARRAVAAVAESVLGEALRQAKALGLSRSRAAEMFAALLDRWLPAGENE